MSSNNYFGFAHGGTQYGQAGSYQTAQTGYAVTPASYTTQRTGYETAYTPAATNSTPATAYASTYGAVSAGATSAATYDYGYARPAVTTYETPKTYYQQPVAATYATTEYQQVAAAKPAYSTSAYATAARQVPLTTQAKTTYAPNTVSYQTQTAQPVAATYSATYVNTTQQQTATQTPIKKEKPVAKYVVPTAVVSTTSYQTQTAQAPATNQTAYSASFSSPQIQVQTAAAPIQTTSALSGTPQWPTYKKPFMGQGAIRKVRPAPKPQQIHYCEVCKISCGGIMTYREHLEGQKHKKKEAAAKAGNATPAPGRHNSSLVCELCDVTCTGYDAYAAHIRGSKHQKVVKLHTKLGKPIPASDPVVVKKASEASKSQTPGPSGAASSSEADAADMDTVEPEVEPVGQDYIEELKTEEGKIVFNCKLCDCRFNDPNAKEMHMKGRRHRLQYKKKVDPELVVDIKMNTRAKKMQEDRLKRQQQREEFYRQREEWGGFPAPPMMPRPYDGPMPPMMGMCYFPPMRRPDSADDRHVIARHSAIFPKKEELDAVHKIVSHNEKALKQVSDFLAEESQKEANKAAGKGNVPTIKSEDKKDEPKKVDGSDGMMFSFHQGKEETQSRVLKAVMRVGTLAKGLLLSGDTAVDLVVLCAEKPTRTLLLKVAENLPKQLQAVAPEEKYMVQKKPEDAVITVMDTKEPHNTVTITLTSPLMREQAVAEPMPADGKVTTPMKPVQKDPPDVLDKGKCLDALAALRHAKWFQARAQGLQSCVMIIRIIRDLCQRVPTWAPLNSWAMELLVERVISSAKAPLSLGDSLRRVMEAVASGILLPGGPGLLDPCEKEPVDAVGNISSQQREDITASAQHALRLIAFRQIHKVLGMDPLPAPKSIRKFPRKRRREGSGGEGVDGGEGKKFASEEEKNWREEGVLMDTDSK